MTGKERRARRKEIAEFVAEGYTLAEAAEHFRVCHATARSSCIEFGTPTDARGVSSRRDNNCVLEVLKHLLDGKTPKWIIGQYAVSRQTVSYVKSRDSEAGFTFRGNNEHLRDTEGQSPQNKPCNTDGIAGQATGDGVAYRFIYRPDTPDTPDTGSLLLHRQDHLRPGTELEETKHGEAMNERNTIADELTACTPSNRRNPVKYADPPTLMDACMVTLLFHSGRTWEQDKENWPAGYEATTKGLCDFIRDAIAGSWPELNVADFLRMTGKD